MRNFGLIVGITDIHLFYIQVYYGTLTLRWQLRHPFRLYRF